MERLMQIDYPKGSGNIIKAQHKVKNDIYLMCFDGYKWKLYLNEKKVKEAKAFLDLIELIPEGK